jgi:hypothetical protein
VNQSDPSTNRYWVYGVRVTSDVPLELPSGSDATDPLADVEFVHGSALQFRDAEETLGGVPEPWFVCHALASGETFLRWAGLYEFLVSADGRCVTCRPLDGCDRSVLQNFLFGQALAVALVRQGIEPLHATVVCIDDHAVGFLGDCTFGKSTLLASFLDAGHRVVTDDLLVLDRRGRQALACPGSGRIKLMPDSAAAFIQPHSAGTPLHPQTSKRAFHLAASARQMTPLPLKQLFVLPSPEERGRLGRVDVSPIPGRAMVPALLKNTFVTDILDRARLARQFSFVGEVAAEIEGAQLRYPAGLEHLPAIRRAIVEHVHRTDNVSAYAAT